MICPACGYKVFSIFGRLVNHDVSQPPHLQYTMLLVCRRPPRYQMPSADFNLKAMVTPVPYSEPKDGRLFSESKRSPYKP